MKFFDRMFTYRLAWVLLGILPMALFAAIMLLLFIGEQERTISRMFHRTATVSAGVVGTVLKEQISLLNTLAAARSLDTGDFESFRQEAENLWALHPEWRTIILTDEARQLLNLRRLVEQLPEVPVHDPESLQQVWQTKAPVVGDLVQGQFVIRVPVIRNDRMLYTITVPLYPAYLDEAVAFAIDGRFWRYAIVGGNDKVITAFSDGTSSAPIGTEMPWLPARDSVVDNLHYAAPVPVPGSNWHLSVYVPAGLVEMPFLLKRTALAVGGGLAAALSIFLVLLLSKGWAIRQESRRLREEIEQRDRAQQALTASEQRFRLLVEYAPEAIYVQTQGRFAYLNEAAARLFGAASIAELAGTLVTDRIHPDYQDLARKRIRLLNDKKQAIPRQELLCVRLDGSTLRAEFSGVPLEYDGKPGGLVFARDLTQFYLNRTRENELEHKLHQVQRVESIGRLAGGVAHDYNNMLGVIIGHAELALELTGPNEPIHNDLREILDAARRSASITRQLLGFARSQAIEPKVLDLNEVVEGMLKMLRRLIGEDIELAWHPRPDLWPVRIDPSQVDQILANLCLNGRDAIEDIGTITIETGYTSFDAAYCAEHPGYVAGDYVLLAISDNGCGMDKQTVGNIFEPFFTTKEKGEGTGLGLATVYGIVRQNEGFINVYSEPGRGTSFRVYLPRCHGAAEPVSFEKAEEAAVGQGETVLLVEDEPAALKLIERLLEGLGYRVIAAQAPLEAKEKAKAHAGTIDLLVTDVVMPEMNGRELAGQLQASYPGLACVFMSGYTPQVIARQGVLAEGVHFIQKPFSKYDLAAKLREALS